jgi:hypothetical protein
LAKQTVSELAALYNIHMNLTMNNRCPANEAPELGMGCHSYNKIHGATLNPFNLSLAAGGSSGGAAAALGEFVSHLRSKIKELNSHIMLALFSIKYALYCRWK